MRLTLALFACLLVAPAMAQQPPRPAPQAAPQGAPEFPDWSGREHCERQMRVMAMESAALLNACLDQEDRSMRQLRQTWQTTPAGPLRHCVRMMETARMRSYMMLNACVEQERNALQDLERRPR